MVQTLTTPTLFYYYSNSWLTSFIKWPPTILNIKFFQHSHRYICITVSHISYSRTEELKEHLDLNERSFQSFWFFLIFKSVLILVPPNKNIIVNFVWITCKSTKVMTFNDVFSICLSMPISKTRTPYYKGFPLWVFF